MEDQRPAKSPAEASREGLEQLEHGHHHATTEKTTNSLHDQRESAAPAPTEEHRGGPLPYIKK